MADNYYIPYEDLPPPPLYLLHDNIPQPPPRTTSLINKSAKVKLQAVLKFQKIAADKRDQREFIEKFKEKYEDPHSLPPPPLSVINQDNSRVCNQANIASAGNIGTVSNQIATTTNPTPVKKTNLNKSNALKNNSYYSWRDEECKPNCPADCNSGMQAGFPRM